MLEIFQKIIALLTSDSTIVKLCTSKLSNGQSSLNVFTGPVDMTMQKQADLLYPSIVLSLVSEVQRTVPESARDTTVQLDIWSRNSQLELEEIYEAVIAAVSYQSGDSGAAHIFWQRLGGAVDLFESDRRVWHRSCTFVVWSVK